MAISYKNMMRQHSSHIPFGRNLRLLAVLISLLVPYFPYSVLAGDQEMNAGRDNMPQPAIGAIGDLLNEGDIAYKKGNMQEAVDVFDNARKQAASSICPLRLKKAIDDRYAIALSQLSLSKARAGEQDIAETLMNQALTISPQEVLVRRAATQLSDVVRFNPAGTKQHADKVNEVNELLRRAYGFFDLGDYDMADAKFEAVLRIDPYNVAARRGMEKTQHQKTLSNNAGQDATRATMLGDVSQAWAMPLPPEEIDVESLLGTRQAPQYASTMDEQLKQLVVPKVDLDNVDIFEAVDFVRRQAVKLGTGTGPIINIIVETGKDGSAESAEIRNRRFNVRLQSAPLSEVLRYIASNAGLQVRSTPYAVKLVPTSSGAGDEMALRTYKVSPAFFAIEAGSDDSVESDPFAADESSNTSKLKVRKSDPKSILSNAGVTFPDGATASYNAGSSTLIVRNTLSNLSLIEDIITTKMAEVPAQVLIHVSFIELNMKKVKELGFEWIVGLSEINGKPGRWLGGGQALDVGIRENMPPPGQYGYPDGLMTGGLRSGNQVDAGDSLTNLVQSGNSRMMAGIDNRKAPGILSVRAVMGNGDITMLMRGLDQNKAADVMNQPQVMAKSGENATFANVRELFYPSEYTEPTLPTSTGSNNNRSGSITPVTPSHPASFEKAEVGVRLEVTPSFTPGQPWVDLQLVPETKEFEGFVNFGNPIMQPMLSPTSDSGIVVTMLQENKILQPVFITRRAPTTVTVASGHTLVIGGLMKSQKIKFEDKVPVFGDIPYLGRLFRSEGVTTEEKALIITVRAEIIDASGRVVAPAISTEETIGGQE